jgi:predicted DNA-binding helix-hairpin-helix protein
MSAEIQERKGARIVDMGGMEADQVTINLEIAEAQAIQAVAATAEIREEGGVQAITRKIEEATDKGLLQEKTKTKGHPKNKT